MKTPAALSPIPTRRAWAAIAIPLSLACGANDATVEERAFSNEPATEESPSAQEPGTSEGGVGSESASSEEAGAEDSSGDPVAEDESGAGQPAAEDESGAGQPAAGDESGAGLPAGGGEPGAEPSAPEDEGPSEESAAAGLVVFQDPDSDFSTADVHDADRQVFHFDGEMPAMVSAETGARDSAWLTDGNQLGPDGSFGFFMIRFGTEAGERRAYFTEVGAGTICNLELPRDEGLSIFATSEPPPSE